MMKHTDDTPEQEETTVRMRLGYSVNTAFIGGVNRDLFSEDMARYLKNHRLELVEV